MAGFDPAKLDAWLTTPPEDREVKDAQYEENYLVMGKGSEELYRRQLGECTHCGGEGCRSCEGDRGDDAYDGEAELHAMEASHERYLGRS